MEGHALSCPKLSRSEAARFCSALPSPFRFGPRRSVSLQCGAYRRHRSHRSTASAAASPPIMIRRPVKIAVFAGVSNRTVKSGSAPSAAGRASTRIQYGWRGVRSRSRSRHVSPLRATCAPGHSTQSIFNSRSSPSENRRASTRKLVPGDKLTGHVTSAEVAPTFCTATPGTAGGFSAAWRFFGSSPSPATHDASRTADATIWRRKCDTSRAGWRVRGDRVEPFCAQRRTRAVPHVATEPSGALGRGMESRKPESPEILFLVSSGFLLPSEPPAAIYLLRHSPCE